MTLRRPVRGRPCCWYELTPAPAQRAAVRLILARLDDVGLFLLSVCDQEGKRHAVSGGVTKQSCGTILDIVVLSVYLYGVVIYVVTAVSYGSTRYNILSVTLGIPQGTTYALHGED